MKDIDISVVLPTYNEGKSIEEVYSELKVVLDKTGKRYEIIFVDDGSIDGSFDIMKDISSKDNKVQVIGFRRNFGEAAALSCGFDSSKGDIIVTMDADLQNDPNDIPNIIGKIESGYDIVSGWRYKRKDNLFTRRIPSVIANWIISMITGVKIHDTGCTLKAYRKVVLENITLYGEMHRFIPALAQKIGVKICEVKVNHRKRKYGKSKYGVSRTMRVILDLINVKFILSYMEKPMQVFGSLGLVCTILGFLSGIVTIIMKVISQVDITGNPTLYLTIFLFIIGMQFVSLGLLGEISTRTYHETQGKKTYVVREKIGG